MKRVGIFAGTFDPVHVGHLAFAQEAAKVHNLDKVVFLIEPKPRRKTKVSSYKDREAMMKLAIKANPKFQVLKPIEDQFTLAKSLPWLQGQFPEADLYLLIGSDAAMHIKNWPNINLLEGVTIILADRSQPGLTNISSSEIRAAIALGLSPNQINKAVLDYVKQHKLYSEPSPSKS